MLYPQRKADPGLEVPLHAGEEGSPATAATPAGNRERVRSAIPWNRIFSGHVALWET
ncbi:hypothetical protein [Streptomyces sp. NPDC056105]|uniref:hypothetical protein n=1 Tax=Streptomyces sp. NPDC056105 TaxID=3345714 RepID=UPI0035DC437B